MSPCAAETPARAADRGRVRSSHVANDNVSNQIGNADIIFWPEHRFPNKCSLHCQMPRCIRSLSANVSTGKAKPATMYTVCVSVYCVQTAACANGTSRKLWKPTRGVPRCVADCIDIT